MTTPTPLPHCVTFHKSVNEGLNAIEILGRIDVRVKNLVSRTAYDSANCDIELTIKEENLRSLRARLMVCIKQIDFYLKTAHPDHYKP